MANLPGMGLAVDRAARGRVTCRDDIGAQVTVPRGFVHRSEVIHVALTVRSGNGLAGPIAIARRTAGTAMDTFVGYRVEAGL